MKYADVVILLLVLFIIYYMVMIASDLYMAKLVTIQEKEKAKETEIDITDEVENFNTIHISREFPTGKPTVSKDIEPETDPSSKPQESSDKQQEIPESQKEAINAAKQEAQERLKRFKEEKEKEEKDAKKDSGSSTPSQPDSEQPIVRNDPSLRPDYRMPLMMGAMTVEDIVNSAKRRAQGDDSALSGIIHRCEAA